MKSLYFLAVVSLFSTLSVTAQNWSLVMPNDTLVYEKEDNNQFFTVWVDSTQVNGTDTTYFMNRISPGKIVATGDTSDICLSEFQYNHFGNILIRERYKAQFCGKKVEVRGVKSIIYYPNFSFVIYPNNSVGTSWICDSVNLDTMKVISDGLIVIPIYQVQDSIKVFEFKGKTFTLSKNHGLISIINLSVNANAKHDLVGNQNRRLGDVIPMDNDLFIFNVGDIFFRHVGFVDSEGPMWQLHRQEISSKLVVNDTIFYGLNNGIDTLKYWVGMNPLLGGFPNTLAVSDAVNFDSSEHYANPIMIVYVFRNDSGQIEKRSVTPYYSGLLDPNMVYCEHDSGLTEIRGNGVFGIYQSGLGVVSERFNFDLHTDYDFLAGYVLNGIPHGDTTSVLEIDYAKFFTIFPSPTNDFINIDVESLVGSFLLEMYDLRGRLITTKTFERDLTLDVSQYQQGIYFAIIKSEDGSVLHREKVVVQ